MVILCSSHQHLCTSSPVGGGGHTALSFIKPNNNRNCHWVLFPFWHQYHFRTMLFRCGSSAAELTSLSAAWGYRWRVQHTSTAEEPSPRSLHVSSPLLPYSRGQLPIPFWDTMTLSFDRWEIFFCWHPSTPFLFHPSFSFSVWFWRSLISAQRQVGWLSWALNESLWNCSCLFDLGFSFLDSGPRYWQQDVTSVWARSNAVWSAGPGACAHLCVSVRILLEHLIMSKTDGKRDKKRSTWTHFNKLFRVQTSLTDPKF